MRLQYLAHEERQVASRERQDLEQLKQELRRLADLTAGSGGETATCPSSSPRGRHGRRPARATAKNAQGFARSGSSTGYGGDGGGGGGDAERQAQLSRLMQERDSLLGSGVYQPHDAVIVNLDRQINQLIK